MSLSGKFIIFRILSTVVNVCIPTFELQCIIYLLAFINQSIKWRFYVAIYLYVYLCITNNAKHNVVCPYEFQSALLFPAILLNQALVIYCLSSDRSTRRYKEVVLCGP